MQSQTRKRIGRCAVVLAILALSGSPSNADGVPPESAAAATHRIAVQALGKIDPNDIPALIKALGSSDRTVKWAASESLGHLGADAKLAIPALAEQLKGSYMAVRQAALWALGKIGADSVPALKEALGAPKKEVRIMRIPIAIELGKLGPTGVAALSEVLKGNTYWIARQAAAQGLAKTGPAAQSAVPVMIEAVRKDSSPAVRRYVAEALGRIGTGAKDAIPALTEAAQDQKEDPGVTPAAGWALSRIGAGK